MRTIVIEGVEFVGVMGGLLLVGAAFGYVMGWDAKYAADVTMMMQMFCTGFFVRGWLERL